MNTEAVMCMAFTRHRPSLMPLSRTQSSIWPVMFTKSIRAGMLKVRYLVKDFMICLVFYDKGEPSPTDVLPFSLAVKPVTLEFPSRISFMRDVVSSVPDTQGRFGPYGGRFVPETLMHALRQLTEHYEAARADPEFGQRLDYYLKHYVGRPSPLYFAERLTAHAGGARIYLKREDLNHTGAHKINNSLGQALLALRMG